MVTRHPIAEPTRGARGLRIYTAVYTFDGRGWVVQFREPDISTFGRTLASAKARARSLFEVYLEVADLAAAGVVIDDEVRLPAAVEAEVRQLVEMRGEAESLRSKVAAETRRATGVLRRAGLSTRDVGEFLGVSGDRVAQIERESALV